MSIVYIFKSTFLLSSLIVFGDYSQPIFKAFNYQKFAKRINCTVLYFELKMLQDRFANLIMSLKTLMEYPKEFRLSFEALFRNIENELSLRGLNVQVHFSFTSIFARD